MIRGVIFDIDGTLLDSLDIWGDVGIRYLKQLGMTVEDEENLSCLLWPMTLAESSAYLKEHYVPDGTEEEIQAGILLLIEDFYKEEVQLKPGVKEMLELLREKEISMALATTGDGSLADAALKRLGIRHYFQALYTASDLQTTKKEPLIFQIAAAHMGCEPAETIVVEDTFYALMTAKKAGFRTAAVYDKAGKENWDFMRQEADLAENGLPEISLRWMEGELG